MSSNPTSDFLTDDFIKFFGKLPERIQNHAKEAYRIWKRNSNHPSLQNKRIHPKKLIYSVRVSVGWRAIYGRWSSVGHFGYRENDTIVWFWIGSHQSYNKLMSQVRSATLFALKKLLRNG